MANVNETPRSDRGPNARKPLTVLLSEEERDELDKALDAENTQRLASGQIDIGLGSKLRELGLVWARSRKKPRPGRR